MNHISIAEEGLARAIARLQYLADKADREGNTRRAAELRRRMCNLCELQ